MEVVRSDLLDRLRVEALASPRLRMNHNFHPTLEAKCHRFFNAIEPGTYIRPHRHFDVEKGETLVGIRGRVGVLIFDDAGTVTEQLVLEPGGEVVAVDIPPGEWHGAVSLEPGSVFFEAKAGPYQPIAEEEWAPWAPESGSIEAADYLGRLVGLFRA